MLTKKHPKKKDVPPVRLSSRQFQAFCDKTIHNLEPPRTLTVDFQGTDGSDITVSDVNEIVRAEDDTIPDVIVMPTVKATSTSGDVIELRPETIQSGSQQSTRYVLAVTGRSQVWAEGVVQATLQWLNRKRTALFRSYYGLVIGLVVFCLGCLLFSVFFGLQISSASNKVYFAPVALPIRLPALVAGVCSLITALIFPKVFPIFSVTVRTRKRVHWPFSFVAALGTVASVITIITWILSLLQH